MATRNISLTDPLDRYIEERVKSGKFQNASEVVRAGLRLLQREDEDHEAKIARLRAAVQEGLDELDRGEGIEIPLDELDDWMSSLGRDATKR